MAPSFFLPQNYAMRVLVLLFAAFLAACMPSVGNRTVKAHAIAAGGDLRPAVTGASIPLQSFFSITTPGAPVWVFVEGDGLAWITPSQPSRNPTPVDPVALRLAASDPAANRLYLARPGQYLDTDVGQRYWLQARFSAEVVNALEESVRMALEEAGSTELVLVGYSGGAALTALLAQRLVAAGKPPLGWMTVAGNVDPTYWTQLRGLSPLAASLDPAVGAATLADVPQVHLSGLDDQAVPSAVLQHFLARYPHQRCVRVVPVPASHSGPWLSQWSAARDAFPDCVQVQPAIH